MLIPEDAQNTLEKMVRVLIRMEADQVSAEQALQNLATPFSR
jgi:hypothetical protein